jgi:hypothetical protein
VFLCLDYQYGITFKVRKDNINQNCNNLCFSACFQLLVIILRQCNTRNYHQKVKKRELTIICCEFSLLHHTRPNLGFGLLWSKISQKVQNKPKKAYFGPFLGETFSIPSKRSKKPTQVRYGVENGQKPVSKGKKGLKKAFFGVSLSIW